jgi:hypothetical protein
MGIFNEIKKLFFTAKSVSKSSKDKIVEEGKKASEELIHKGSEVAEKVRENLEEFGEDVVDFGEKIGEEAYEQGSKLVDKAKEFAEDVGSRVLGKDEDISDEEFSEDKPVADDLFEAEFEEEEKPFEDEDEMTQLGEEVNEFVPEQGPRRLEKEDEPGLVDQARAAVDKFGKDLDEAVEEIQEMEKKEMESKPLSDSLKKGSLEDKDDFFKKAAAFAEGKYSALRNEPEINKPGIQQPDEESKKGTVPGFEDMDGDGDEIIDDAVIESEEE